MVESALRIDRLGGGLGVTTLADVALSIARLSTPK
jgi:hypothetical protein